jgi:hypothetical protein
MRLLQALLCAAILVPIIPIQKSMAQAQQGSFNVPTSQETSRLVFLDVTVVTASWVRQAPRPRARVKVVPAWAEIGTEALSGEIGNISSS